MIENLNEFKKLYSEFYEALPETYTKLICPFFGQTGRDYYDTRPRCLFIGKATNGWMTESRNVDNLFGNGADTLVNWGIEWTEKNNSDKKSAFWRVIKATTRNLFPKTEWHTHIAWSNLYKFSPPSGNPGVKLQRLQSVICTRILDKEIEALLPDFVIFLTSGWEDFYAKHIGLKFENSKHLEWDGNKTFYQKKGATIYIQSVHPQGKKEAPHIEALTEIIKGKS